MRPVFLSRIGLRQHLGLGRKLEDGPDLLDVLDRPRLLSMPGKKPVSAPLEIGDDGEVEPVAPIGEELPL